MPTLKSRIATTFLSLCAPLLLVSTSAGQVCDLTITASIGGPPQDLAVAGETAYAADSRGGLMIFDIAEPARIASIGRIQLTGITGDLQRVAVDGDLLYAVDDGNQMFVFGIINPAEPRLLGIADAPVFPNEIHFEDQFACSFSPVGGLSVYDFSNPLSPVLLDNAPTKDISRDLAIENGYAYLADLSVGLRRFDLSDRENLLELSTVLFAGDVEQVESDNGLVFVLETTESGSSISIVDVSEPLMPLPINSIPVPDGSNFRVAGSVLYLASGDSMLRLIDVTDPLNPDELGAAPTPATIFGMTILGEGLLLLRGLSDLSDDLHELSLVDAQDASSPAVTARFRFPEQLNHARTRDGLVYVTNGSPSLQIYDTSEPGAIIALGAADAAPDGLAVAVDGDQAYVAHGSDGVAVFDIQDPANPSVIGSVRGSALNNPTDITVHDGFAYVSRITGQFSNSGRLVVLDVSNPASPQFEVSGFELNGRPGKMQAEGDRLYVALENRGIDVIDISDPTEPARLSTFTAVGQVYDLHVFGETVYVAGGFRGFGIVDARDPALLLLVREADIFPGVDEQTNRIRVANGFAYLTASNESTLYTIDFSNPFNLMLVDTRPDTSTPMGIDLDGDRLVVTKGVQGLDVIDIGPCLTETCAPDLNGDGIVDAADLGRLIGSFRQADSAADINGDGIVDQSDLGILISQFGVVCSR